MLIYEYDPTTLVFTGTSNAHPSPLEPGKWLVPAFATKIVPPSCVAGKRIKFLNGAWSYEDVVIEPETPTPEPTLAEVRARKQAEIRDKADAFLSTLAPEYGAMEKLTWDQQAVESDALAANPDAPAPLVRSIATARSMDPLELAARIRANRAQWVLLSGAIVGQRLAYQDALDAAQTVEEIGAIVPEYGLG